MKKIFSILLFATLFSNAQETEFKFTQDGFTDYVVTPCPGKTKAELYKKTLEWVSETFKNTKVIKSKIENEFIRINGSSKNLVCFNTLTKSCTSSKFTLDIYFKDGKYKFDVIAIEYVYSGEKKDVNLTNTSEYYNSKGELRTNYKYFPEIADFFNNLNLNLANFEITNRPKTSTTTSKKNDW
jgi:hypothetical protein